MGRGTHGRCDEMQGLTFEHIAQAMNKDEVWVAALFYGQVSSISLGGMRRMYLALKAKASEEELLALGAVLQLQSNWMTSELGPHWYPNRGIGPIPPTDPVIYRLFEVSVSPMAILFSAYPL